MTTSQSTKARAQETAGTAADEGRHVAGVAKEEAANVVSEATTQAKNVVGDALSQVTGQVSEQTRTQRDRLVGTLQTFADDLEQMASQASVPGLASDVARQVADRTRSLSSQLDGREPTELLEDVRHFARRRPGVFLLGALAAGVVTGRIVRGTKDGVAGAAAASTPSSTGAPVGAPISTSAPVGTTNPPMPSVTPGYQTTDAPPTALDEPGTLGAPPVGYGDRGTLGEERLP